MKIKNLKVGQVLKNYKHLCEVLEIEPLKTGSDSYKAQMKEIKRKIDFEREGHKIIITKIYSKEKKKMDKRSMGNGNNSIHADNIEYMILTLLSKIEISKHERVGFSKNFLFSYTGLSNENFKIAKKNKLEFSQMIDMPVQEINECFDYTNNRMLKTLQSTFNSMKRKALITWGNGYNMVMKDIYNDNKEYLKIADAENEKVILAAEKKILNRYGYNNKRQVFLYSNWNRFKKEVEREIKKTYDNLAYYYDCIHFNYNNKDIKKALKSLQKEGAKECLSKGKVNDNFSKSLDGTITRKNKKSKEENKDKDIKDLHPFESYRSSDDYVPSQKLIKHTIVDKDAKKIEIKYELDKEKVKKKQKEFYNKYGTPNESEQIIFDLDSEVPF